MTRLLTIALVLLAGPGWALSCLPTSPTMAFNRAAEADERYVVLYGRLNFDEGRLPVTAEDQVSTPPRTDIPARFSGHSLTRKGFTNPLTDVQMTLRALCFGPWCGGMAADVDHLLFVELTDDGYRLSVDPCGGSAFAKPSARDLNAVRRCLRGGPCPNEPRR